MVQLPDTLKTVCVYCGSSSHSDEIFKNTARNVGAFFAERKIRIVYGGGHVGLMGLLADAALDKGGEVIGIIPEHIRAREVQHDHLTELHVVKDMHIRKAMMAERADAFVVLPGGFGTLDETFEILTWRMLGLHNKPILLFNEKGFWDPMIALIDHLIDEGFVPAEDRKLYTVVSSLQEMEAALAAPVGAPIDISNKWA